MVSNWLTHDIMKLDNKLKTVIRNFFIFCYKALRKLFDSWNYKSVTSLVQKNFYMLEILYYFFDHMKLYVSFTSNTSKKTSCFTNEIVLHLVNFSGSVKPLQSNLLLVTER